MKTHTYVKAVTSFEDAIGFLSGPEAGLMTVLGYVRVSTKGQFDKSHLAQQIERIQLFAQRRGLKVIKIYREVRNGALISSQDRPALHDCLKHAAACGSKILTTSPSRLSRNAEHAEQLCKEYPDRFMFVEPLPGYEGQPWHHEVAEHHAAFPELTKTGTVVAMDKQKRDGRTFGAGDGGVAGRAAAAKVLTENKRTRLERLADMLAEHPDWRTMTRREAATYLNGRGHHPPRSTSQKPTSWTVGSITRPLDETRKILDARRYAASAIPCNDLATSVASPSRTRSPICGGAKDEIVVAGGAADASRLAEATKRASSTQTGVKQTLASYDPPRGAAEARADTDNSESTAVLGLGRSAGNQGSASSAFPDHPDIAHVSVNKIDPGVAVDDAELTAAGMDTFDVCNNPLWGRF
ncbi:recombinase family protein [Loktanella salsilacus]|uniref:recombinase family protein n=1 Tax=Loktanella salsilacus TaxID=195913 RepID=UPI0037362726